MQALLFFHFEQLWHCQAEKYTSCLSNKTMVPVDKYYSIGLQLANHEKYFY